MIPPSDLTQRFLLENLDIRGQVVRLGPAWRQILARRDYPEALRPLLAEFAALAVLIGSGLKHPGRAVLQVMGHGPDLDGGGRLHPRPGAAGDAARRR